MLVDRSSRRSKALVRAGRLVLASAAAATLVVSCAVQQKAPASRAADAKSDARSEAPASVDEALADLERAESDLNQAVAVFSPRQQEGVVPAPAPPPTATVQSAQPAQTAPTDAAPSAQAPSEPTEIQRSRQDPCSTACSALASMQRATDHRCALAGDADPRCEGARSRVRGANERVRATCPACMTPG